ncbi:acetyltransferase [Modestobacter sp. L9-4]|uniref:acetyltransferase n=1 Tax=Modestobacter sp. L9-4 TaxID=2851567 RepID=UPI001F35544C|nr:acetyltransferase [Modestobacter sp. L9-4]
MTFGEMPVYDVYGAGGHAQVVVDALRACGIGLRRMYNDSPANQHPASRDVLPGIRLVGPDAFPLLDVPLVLAVGINGERAELAQVLDAHYGQAVHPTAIVAPSARIGEGTVVLAGAMVQPNARIGRHVLVNTGASVDHDCDIGDYAHISPQAALSGHVTVGEGTHIGVGAVVIPKVRIGRWCKIGAGTVVIADLPDHVTAVGNPARILPDRSGEVPPDPAFVRSGGRQRTGVRVP